MSYKDPKKQKEAQHRHYIKNKDKYVSRHKKSIIERRKYLAKFKDKPCVDCGIRYPHYVMDLDHRVNENKVCNLAQMIHRYAWKSILEEIKKCDIVCSNCHRIRTYKRKSEAVA